MQTGKVQQYAALLFAGAAVLAGICSCSSSRSHRTNPMKDFLNDWGLTLAMFLPAGRCAA